MKKIFTFIAILFLTITVFAQAPQKMSYQAVIRNSNNNLVVSTVVGMQISILQGSENGTPVYVETQTPTSNANGLVSIEIGGGNIVFGSMGGINWASGAYFIKTETDPSGGTNYTITGTSQLMSVPFALYAASSGNLATTGANVGDMQYWNGTSWTNIPIGKPGQVLQINDSNIPEWGGSTIPKLTTNPAKGSNHSAQSGGTVIEDGLNNQFVTDTRGVCWSTSPNPTIQKSTWNITSSDNPFTVIMYDLEYNKTYYYRAFIANDHAIGYGNELVYTPLPPILVVPIVTTNPVTGVTGATAISGGKIVSSDSVILQNGVCWGTSPNPTIADSKTTKDNYGGPESIYTSYITGLSLNTTYYVRAYATNSAGTGYGEQISFTTTTQLSVGNSYQGGLIGYIFKSGDPGYIAGEMHGLIIASEDQGTAPWGCQDTNIGTESTLGSGNQNTIKIMNGCATAGIAAKICGDLVLNGYSDWFLASSGEWINIADNFKYLNSNLSNNETIEYWTSTEKYNYPYSQSSYIIRISNDFPKATFVGKNDNKKVRAVRSF